MSPRISDPEERAALLHEKAMALRDAGRPNAARLACARALALFEKHAGPRHPDVANVLLELAAIEQDRGHYAEALRLARRAIGILALLPGDVVFTRLRFQALCQVGDLRIARGEYRLAEAPLARSSAKRRRCTSESSSAMMSPALTS